MLRRLNRRIALSTGMWTTSSMLTPIEVPRAATTPITRKRLSPIRIVRPSGFSRPKSSRCRPAPMTQTGASRAPDGR